MKVMFYGDSYEGLTGYSKIGREFVKRFKEHGFEVVGLFVAGYNDSLQYIQSIPAQARELGLDCFNASILTPFPGTEVYKRMIENKMICEHDWSKYDFFHCVYNPIHTTQQELESAVRSTIINDPLSLYNYGKRS